jgi:hypothetical protein
MKAFLPQHYGTKLASEIGTAQKGSQPLICSLIFAFGNYPIAGVMGLVSSCVTIIIAILFSLEMGKHYLKKTAAAPSASPAPAAASAPAPAAAPAPAVAPTPAGVTPPPMAGTAQPPKP